MKKNCIIIDGIEYTFIPEKNVKRECCQICDLKDICFNKLKSDSLICNIHTNQEIPNGYYQILNK